jgi:hypothetical protein
MTSLPQQLRPLPTVDNGRQKVGDTRLEHPHDIAGNTGGPQQGGAESGALGARETALDPDLAALIKAWPALPATVQANILAVVRAAGKV